MARSHAQIYVTIWIDDDFRALSLPAQHAYFLLCSQGDLSHAGVLTLSPRRLANLTNGATVDTVQDALDELERHRFILVDRDTEELLIRTYVRHDKVLHKPNVTKAMARSWGSILSPTLRQAIVDELPPLLADGFPSNVLDGTPAETSALLRAALGKAQTTQETRVQRNPSRKGSRKGSGNPSGNVSGRVPATPPATSGGGGGGGGGGELGLSKSSSSADDDDDRTETQPQLADLWDLLAQRRLNQATTDGHPPSHPHRWLTTVRTDIAQRHTTQARQLLTDHPNATTDWLANQLDPQTATNASTIPNWEATKAAQDARPPGTPMPDHIRTQLAEFRNRKRTAGSSAPDAPADAEAAR